MRNLEQLPKSFQVLYNEGLNLLEHIVDYLDSWPARSGKRVMSFENTAKPHQEAAFSIIIDTRLWFNKLKLEVLPYTLKSQNYLTRSLADVELAIKKKREVVD